MSTRFGLERPKFLQSHPSGGTMLSRGVGGKLSGIDEIVVITLEEFFLDISKESLIKEFKKFSECSVRIVTLRDRTSSMVETIYQGLEILAEEFSFIVKDTDNFIEVSTFLEALSDQPNLLGYFNLNENDSVSHKGKSYVHMNSDGFLTKIVEKSISSNFINTGLVSFRSASEFMSFAEQVLNRRTSYVSDVIKLMMQNDIKFKTHEIRNYIDWGTLKEWQVFKDSFATFFVDLDGTLLMNSHPLGLHTHQNWLSFKPIEENIQALLKIYERGKAQIVFTTSRSAEYRNEINNYLTQLGFQSFTLITDLYHSKRILINDFSDSNRFPTAIAINIKRNNSNLSEFLDPYMKI